MRFLGSVNSSIGSSISSSISARILGATSTGGFWDSIATATSTVNNSEIKQPKNFDKYNQEIEKIKQYIKVKREAFYKNNNLEER